MSAPPQLAGSQSFLFFVVLLVLIVILRVRRVITGTKVSVGRTIGFSAYYLALAGLFVSSSYAAGVPAEYFIVYALLLIGGLTFAYRFSRKSLSFWKNPEKNGAIYSKGGLVIYAIYIAGLIARVSIEYLFLGSCAFFTFPAQSVCSLTTPSAFVATILTDLLLMFGAGLLVGRNMQLYKRYKEIKKNGLFSSSRADSSK